MKIKEIYILTALVLFAFTIRVLFIWVGRPEFVGWFNHTYYYFVQTKGLLETGSLPFNDMPLLFYVYAYTSKLLISVGMDIDNAVVNTTRFWMSLIPSLLPVPVYRILRKISINQKLTNWGWVVLIAMAFYPLSILYMPEFLQKNALGLLFLAFLINQSIALYRKITFKNISLFSGVFLLLVLTHYGSAGVALLYCMAMAVALSIQRNKGFGLKIATGVLAGLGVALYTFSFFDIDRFERVGYYVERVFDTSTLGVLLGSNSEVFDRILSLVIILVPIGIMVFLYKLFLKSSNNLPGFIKDFWLVNMLFAYLLVLPVYDQLLLGRFSLFLPLAIAPLLYLTLQYASTGKRLKKVVLGAILIGVVVMVFGEFMSWKLHNRNKEEVFEDIIQLKAAFNLNENDLVIGRNGVEHISNWFLGTKSCIITSFNRRDFEQYERVFLLNPTERGMRIQGRPNKSINWYNLILGNVPEPENGTVVYSTTHLRLIELTEPPVEWYFDENGNWESYEND